MKVDDDADMFRYGVQSPCRSTTKALALNSDRCNCFGERLCSLSYIVLVSCCDLVDVSTSMHGQRAFSSAAGGWAWPKPGHGVFVIVAIRWKQRSLLS